jgi:hypothetical protein
MTLADFYRAYMRRLFEPIASPESSLQSQQQQQPQPPFSTGVMLGAYYNIQRKILKIKGLL